jgi:hypothetical protein
MDAALKARLLATIHELVAAHTRASIAQEMARRAQEGAETAQADIARLSDALERILVEEH